MKAGCITLRGLCTAEHWLWWVATICMHIMVSVLLFYYSDLDYYDNMKNKLLQSLPALLCRVYKVVYWKWFWLKTFSRSCWIIFDYQRAHKVWIMFSCESRSVRRTTLLNFVLNKCNGVALYQSIHYVLQQLCRQSKLKYSSSSVLLGALSLYLNHTLAWHIHGEQPRLVALVVSFICIFF